MPFDHHAKAPAPLRQEAVLPAQSRHPVPATSHAGKPQRMPHLHGAVAGLRLLMELLDLHEQPRVGCRPRTGRSRPPRIVAASTDAQRPTQLAQPVSRAMRLDEAIPHGDSRAKNPAAFFKMSRSSRSRAF